MIGATPPSSICTGARRRQLREFAPHSPGKPYSSVEGRKPVSREPARSWCTEPRKAMIFRFRCTKS